MVTTCFAKIDNTRTNGGGVALFVDKKMKAKIVEPEFECVKVDIVVENRKNILLTCVYRDRYSSIYRYPFGNVCEPNKGDNNMW